MAKRKTKAKRADVIDVEIIDAEIVDRPTPPPIVIDVKRPKPAPAAATIEAFGMQAVVTDVKEAFAAGESLSRMLRRFFR